MKWKSKWRSPSNRSARALHDSEGPPPLAVLYEVVPGADMVELHTAIDHAKAFWPGAPLVACRRQTNGYQSHNLRSLDGATLKRLGFRAIADKSAQLPGVAARNRRSWRNSGELKLAGHRSKSRSRRELALRCRRRSKSITCVRLSISSRRCTSSAIKVALQTRRSPV